MLEALTDPGVPVAYYDLFREFSIIIRDSESVRMVIGFCPWCGEKLPSSMRNAWFDRLDALGIDDPNDPRIPVEMQSGDWWRHEGL